MLPDQPGDLNACSGRVRRSLEELPPHLSGPLVILEGEKVVGRLDDVSNEAPASFRIFSNLWKMRRVWATMSPLPTTSRFSFTAVVPEMNNSRPARTAGENVIRSGQLGEAILS